MRLDAFDPGGFEPPAEDMFVDVVGPGDLAGGGFGGFFGFVLVVGVLVAVVSVVMAARRAKKLHDAGIDPLDPETDLQVRMARSRAMAPAPRDAGGGDRRPVAERLAEVDRLHAEGTITSVERDAARARILGAL
ncbi:hypothetical protein [Isoptericola sp. NPDC019482]|uniref:hypothetical protein n=1 Tax=Isoptericola sp. NPDC019482 TaxID=3154688 RepID=UPI00348FAA05